MSIASELQDLNDNILDAYDAIDTKGGAIPQNKNMANMANAISSISGGGGGGATNNSTQPTLLAYDRSTGVLTGAGLGTSGVVYVFDRMQNKGVAVATSSWTGESIKLSTPVDLANLTGTTSIWVVPTGYVESNKLMLRGDISVPGYGILYYANDSGAISAVTIASSTEWGYLAGHSTVSWSETIGGVTIWNSQIVGLQVGSSATTINSYFMHYCYNFNQPLDLSGITSTNSYFMRYCYGFNQSLDLSNITSIGNYFMNCCYGFNQPLDLPEVTQIGNNFMYYCYGFNQPLDLSKVTSIGNNFMAYCYGYNQLLDLSSATAVGNYFMSYCYSFNRPINLPKITKINANFMSSCYSFNQPLDLPEVTQIGNNFMYYCYGFNQPLDLSKVTSIGNYFLYTCYGYNQKITLATASVSTYFLYECISLAQIDVGNSTISSSDYSLSTSQNTAKMYVNGITLTGANASTWKSTLADRTSSPYRKLIDGTA